MCKSALLLAAMCLAGYGQALDGWGSTGAVQRDENVRRDDRATIRIDRPTGSGSPGFNGITRTAPMDFGGKTLTLSAWLRTENVTGYVGLWMREDGESGPLGFDNMERRQLKGTTDWQEYTVTVPLHEDAKRLFWGVFVADSGRVWVHDVRVLVDGKPLSEAPKREIPKTSLDEDHEFDAGSRVAVTQLTAAQVENLVLLGKVWGFLKYHHPAIVSGKRHWDYDLFRVLPSVIAASDRRAAQEAIRKWVAGVGAAQPCEPCAALDTGKLHFGPALGWLDDQSLLGPELSKTLRAIYTNRPAGGKQFYVSRPGNALNPSFDHEPVYMEAKPGDSGFQILSAYRFWNIVEYWFPYRDVITGKWDEALRDTLPKIATAAARQDYHRELMALIARVEDTHANLWSSLTARPPVGSCSLAVTVRFAEAQAVIEESRRDELKRGDVLTALDGVAVAKLVEQWSPYYAASNQPTRLRDMARQMTHGACGPVTLKVRRGSEELEVKAERTPAPGPSANRHDRPGDTFQRLSPEVAYLKLSSVKQAEVNSYLDKAAGSKGLIIDIRNYPSEFMPFALGGHLVDKPTPFARFTHGDLVNPGAFHWIDPILLTPIEPRYQGKVIILVDEVSQSQSEYTTMALRTAPGAKVLGSTTAGADGNVSAIALPGGLRSMISGIGVFYPDKRPTQKIGILPDIEVKPTIAGIRDGRDELVEAAIREILKD